ncbi:hypothetical protein SLEP1_g1168 [Rubroshorea leprosula]|uniref:Uncharacterized protein n=1 Tax=Rubroshorea leprosula TaxID=152421 RepID=A0AAV5HIV5_9ROSI|nr:hypothetical protein SLEP1_g1168 [Rubroshorea leprosula]
MSAADDGDLPNIAPSSSGGLNSGFETVSPASVFQSVSPRSRRSGDGGLGTYAGVQSSAHGWDCSPVFSEGREQNLEMFKETNLGHNRSPRVAGKSIERITKNIDHGDLTVESSDSQNSILYHEGATDG